MVVLAISFAISSVKAQDYAGFVDDLKNASTDSLMKVDGIEYYLLYEDYEKVHFLSLLSEKRETFIIGPAVPCDTLYQNGNICGKLGVERISKPLAQMKNDSLLVDVKFPELFTRCESVSPCNFKACDTNNFGYKILIDYPSGDGAQWDYLRFWLINYVDTFTNMDMFYYDDVYLEKNIDKDMLPTEVIRKQHPEAFEIDDIRDGQAVVDHFRDMYMRQVYFLKNLDFSFPLTYLRLFITPRFYDGRYVTLFISTNFYAYSAHDFPIERYVTFDMKRMEVVSNKSLFKNDSIAEVKKILMEEMKSRNTDVENIELPQVAIMGDNLVFSFQPYQIGTFADGISHFMIPKNVLKHLIVKDRLW